MRKPVRFVLYIMIGFIMYQIIDSGETTVTHGEVKNVLIIAILVVFALLMIVRVIKSAKTTRMKVHLPLFLLSFLSVLIHQMLCCPNSQML